MADFNVAYKETMKIEGLYANNPNDSGGETWKGIARKKHPAWAGWAIVDSYRSKPGFPGNLVDAIGLQEQVLSFYKKAFWDMLSLDKVSDQRIGNELFDTGLNMGMAIAGSFLQRALNLANRNEKDYADLPVDGVVGVRTISTLNNSKDQNLVLKLLNILQGARYISICENDPTQEIFLRSWMSRVEGY